MSYIICVAKCKMEMDGPAFKKGKMCHESYKNIKHFPFSPQALSQPVTEFLIYYLRTCSLGHGNTYSQMQTLPGNQEMGCDLVPRDAHQLPGALSSQSHQNVLRLSLPIKWSWHNC